jgi:hypothetical protein
MNMHFLNSKPSLPIPMVISMWFCVLSPWDIAIQICTQGQQHAPNATLVGGFSQWEGLSYILWK